MTMVVDELRGMKSNRRICWRPLASGANKGRWYACEGRRWTCGGDGVYWVFIYLLWIIEILKE